MDYNCPIKKRKRNNSIENDEDLGLNSKIWNVRVFKSKPDLEKYINDHGYKYRSSEEKTVKQRCRFCLALNPNSLQHMIQVYLNCSQCRLYSKNNCSKTNICEKLEKYELLTRHKDLSQEWIIFDQNNTAVRSIQKIDFYLNQFKSIDINSDELSNTLPSINSSTIKNEYNTNADLYVWVVKDVLPSQRNLFKEAYIIRRDDEWIEFFNGEERHSFINITSLSDGYILRREDGALFKLNSNEFFNCDEKTIKYEGEWVCDKNKQNPCLECSAEIEKMVFDCDHLAHEIDDLDELEEERVWKAKFNYGSRYFKRRDTETWDEYCNDQVIDTFKFIGFDINDNLIILQTSKENPDYLRFTDRDVFIGQVKDYIYYPMYTGFWQKETKNENASALTSTETNLELCDLSLIFKESLITD